MYIRDTSYYVLYYTLLYCYVSVGTVDNIFLIIYLFTKLNAMALCFPMANVW